MSRIKRTLNEAQIDKLRKEPPAILNTTEMAALYGVARSSAQEWTRHRTFPGQRFGARGDVFVDRDDLKTWLKGRYDLVRDALQPVCRGGQ